MGGKRGGGCGWSRFLYWLRAVRVASKPLTSTQQANPSLVVGDGTLPFGFVQRKVIENETSLFTRSAILFIKGTYGRCRRFSHGRHKDTRLPLLATSSLLVTNFKLTEPFLHRSEVPALSTLPGPGLRLLWTGKKMVPTSSYSCPSSPLRDSWQLPAPLRMRCATSSLNFLSIV